MLVYPPAEEQFFESVPGELEHLKNGTVIEL